jgi:hypothetical protein
MNPTEKIKEIEKCEGYVNSWDIKDKKDIHISHRTPVWTLEQVQKMLEQREKEILEDYKGFVTEIWNSLEDDIEIDKKGEQGYKSSDECIKAIRKYTLPIIKKKSEALKSQIQTKEGKC